MLDLDDLTGPLDADDDGTDDQPDPKASDHDASALLQWWLTDRRERLGLSWEDVARATGTVPMEVQQWAEGNSFPEPAQVLTLARRFRDPSHPPGAEPLPGEDVEPGRFVIAGNGLGIGKCVEIDGDTATVEYFDTVARQEERHVPAADLTTVRLSDQTRCYVYNPDTDRWTMGRVKRLRDGDRVIELPDQEVDHVDQDHLFVRWARPVADPTETLKQKGQETVFFRNQRTPFVQSLLEQRAASRGASGLLSSNVDLYPHQVDVVQRVLEDPVPRYWLADEPGLGVTVEAGVVIRQVLIDLDDADVRVFVPASQTARWERELDDKFDVDALGGTVTVEPHEVLADVEEEGAPDLLVIDDAHRIADADAFGRIAGFSHEAERLLLLSSTPARPEEAETLAALLHLLDPDLYPDGSADAVRDRLDTRDAVGRRLQAVTDDPSPETLAALREDIGEDEALSDAVDAAEDALDENPAEAVATLRKRVLARHRLHPRMLRNRRSDAENAVSSYRSAPRFPEQGADPREEEVHALLDAWREQALADVSSDDPVRSEADTLRLFRLLLVAAASDLDLLARIVRTRLGTATDEDTGEDEDDSVAADLRPAEDDTLREAPFVDGEEGLLKQLDEATVQDEADADDDFVWTKEEWLEQLLERNVGPDEEEHWVIFVTHPSVAEKLHTRLTRAFGRGVVAIHKEGQDLEDREENVRQFREDPPCQVFVCDRSAEDGPSLPFADHLVHYDLPWDANRIERRTGRLDRIRRDGRALQTHVYVGPMLDDDSLYEAWYRMLDEGFGVLDASMAGLHGWVDDRQPQLLKEQLQKGTEDVDARVASLQGATEAEREALERQHAFEAVDAPVGEDDAFERLQNLENESGRLKSDLDGWIADALHFHRNQAPYPDGMLQYQPNFQGKTLVPFDTIMNRFLPQSDKPVTYQRSLAVDSREETGTAASVFRIGHPFLDGIRDYFEWDDRGRAYAIWRQSEAWKALDQDDRLFFRFEFVVQASVESDRTDAGQAAALQRRADASLPPRFETVVTDQDGSIVTNDRLVDIVAAPPRRVQDGGTDENVKGDDVHLLDAFVDPVQWPMTCESARTAAEEAIRKKDALTEQLEAAKARAEADSQRRLRRLRLRVGDAEDVTDEQVQQERDVADLLHRGIDAPDVRLDSVGVVILSGNEIPVEDDEE